MALAPEGCGCAYPPTGASVTSSPICSSALLFLTILEQFINGRCAISDPCRRITGTDDVRTQYDFIVVGGGSAGSVVAGRLAENPNFNILLIEAGGIDPVATRVPAFYRNFWYYEGVDWLYRTVPGDYCLDQGARGCSWIRGKAIGGTSIHNGMMYHRGHRADYEDWKAAGAVDWGWEQNLPYFLASENNQQIGLVDAKYHGTSGPMPISRLRYQPPFVRDILKAANESGYPVIADMNDPRTPEGFTIAQTFSNNGQRYTTARAFIEERYESRATNLEVVLESHVTRVLFNGTQAIGVEFLKDGVKRTVYSSKEVILSAGALNTPQILMLSGIGPSDILDKFSIPPVVTLPVGRNLLNHIGATLHFILENEYNEQTLNWAEATEYLLERTGPMTSTGITQVTGLLYSQYANRSREQPDQQFFFNGFFAECSNTGVPGEPVGDCPQNGRNISINAAALLPRSVGYITLNSTNPLDAPLFFANYFSDPYDMLLLKDAILKVKAIVESETFQSYGIKWDPSYSACDNAGTAWTDPWMECVARTYTDPQAHQQGTASIGTVVDQDLTVFNVTNLRVIDASVMPTLPTGNPQGAIMMVAERGADFIKAQWS